MKAFMNFTKKLEAHPRLQFALQVLGFYVLMMALFLYFMTANLSSAPEFVYTQF